MGYRRVILLLQILHSWKDAVCASESFEYGYDFLSSDWQVIPPNNAGKRRVFEVCEGNFFILRCQDGEHIKLAKNTEIQFGRNGAWEKKSKCGGGEDVSHCTTKRAKKWLLRECEGRQTCRIHLNGTFPGKDPCPAVKVEGVLQERPRKYLTVRYSCCNNKVCKRKKSKLNETKRSTVTFTDEEEIKDGQEEEDREGKGILFKNVESTTDKLDRYTRYKSDKKLNHYSSYSPISISRAMDDDIIDPDEQALEEDLKHLNINQNEEEVKKSVGRFLIRKFDLSIRNPFESKDSLLHVAERVGGYIMNQFGAEGGEFEVSTKDVSLKVVKKQLTPGAETNWVKDQTMISLPDQDAIQDDNGDIRATLASYNNLSKDLESASDIITVSVNKAVNLTKPITFIIPNNGSKEVSCAFWSFPSTNWSRDGCTTVCHNNTHTKCSCNHLTNFALIFNVHENFVGESGIHSTRLTYITYIGFTISIFCMFLTIVVFITHRKVKKTERDIVHINLCMSLLTAEFIFMFGIQETNNSTGCAAIAGLLHYFFLASFGWMFLEGYQIYVMLAKVFESKSSRIKYYFFLGYIIPLMVVILSYVVDHLNTRSSILEYEDSMCWDPLQIAEKLALLSKASSYGTAHYCWLRVDNHFVLSFIIPAVGVIFSNIGFLLFAIWTMLAHKYQPANKNSRDVVIAYMKGVGVIMCLLGSTWVFGLLYLVINSLFLAYAFTILNSLQGVGIFIFQCLLNPEINPGLKKKMEKIGCCRERKQYKRTSGQAIQADKDKGKKLSLTTSGERVQTVCSSETRVSGEDEGRRLTRVSVEAAILTQDSGEDHSTKALC